MKRRRSARLLGCAGLLVASSCASECDVVGQVRHLEDQPISHDLPPFPEAGARDVTTGDVVVPDGASPGMACPTDVIDATTFPWMPPRLSPKTCTQDDLDALVAFVDVTSDPQKWHMGPWTSNEACRECVFAKETTTWPPMILNNAGQLAALNPGGCIALASNDDACGKAYAQHRSCYLEACADCSNPDDGSFAKCRAAADAKACKKGFDDRTTACGGLTRLAELEAVCAGTKYPFEGSIRAQCIGLPDAGP